MTPFKRVAAAIALACLSAGWQAAAAADELDRKLSETIHSACHG